MNTRKPVILFSVLAALLFVGLAKKVALRHEEAVADRQIEQKTTAVLTPGLKPEFIAKVILYKGARPDEKIVLRRGAMDLWYLESRYGIRAREGQLLPFLKSLCDLKGEVRSTSKSVFGDFKIADKEGIHIVLESDKDKDIAHLVVGLNMPAWGANFVRRSEAEQVVMIQGNILGSIGIMNPDSKLVDNYLADYRLITETDPKQADRVALIYPKASDSFVIVKTGDTQGGAAAGWRLEPESAKATIDTARVDAFLGILSEITGRDTVDPKGTGYGLEKPQVRVKVDVKTPDTLKQVELQLGGPVPNKGMYYVRVMPRGV